MNTHRVVDWAQARGIFDTATPQSQFVKMVEEVGEIAECIAKDKQEEVKLEIGDLVVTAILLSSMYGYTLGECLDSAYDKIHGRKGVMKDGIFIKEGD